MSIPGPGVTREQGAGNQPCDSFHPCWLKTQKFSGGGGSISLELAAAIEGEAPWTNDLRAELAEKRPHNHAERVQAEMNAALEGLAATVEAERATRAAKTPSPAEMQRQISLSRELAYRGPQQ